MPDLVGFRTFQKIRFFLAGALPFLARIGPPAGWQLSRVLQRFPRVAGAWQRVRSSRLGAAGERVASTFILGHYSEDRLDWATIPRDSVAVLRTAVVVAALLCVLVPLAMAWVWPAVSAERITGTPAVVAGWSIWLWFLAVSLGWSALLTGAASASRLAFLPALALFAYFSAAAIGALPKSWWSLLVPAQAALAAIYSETRAATPSLRNRLGRAIAVCLAGAIIAALTIVVIPTAPWFRGRLWQISLAFGVPLGALLWYAGALLQRRAVAAAHPNPPLRTDAVIAALTGANLLLLTSLTLRGGLATPAGSIHAFAVEMTGFLWPFYFFVGAGVVFKILRQTTAVQRVAENVFPASWFIPTALSLLVLALAVAWLKPILLTPAFPWPRWLVAVAEGLYQASEWLWHSSLIRMAMDPVKWAVLAAVLVALYSAARRRLTSALMARLLFAVILVTFVVVEYYFQAMGFLRTPRNSAFSLLIFTTLILWLVHRTAFQYLLKASPWWPVRARLALYSALLLFALLPIHARAALHDARLMNEIFLYLFAGALNFGVPYYVYLYAKRRFAPTPVAARSALGSVLIGAAISVLLILGDKMVVAGGSLGAAWTFTGEQTGALLEGRELAIDALLPAPWILLRGLIVVGSLLALGVVERGRQTPAFARAVFRVVGVAAGIACFSNRGIELPLMPRRVAFLIAPIHSSPLVDASFVATTLGILLPALVLSLALGMARRATAAALVAAAYASYVTVNLVWPAQEAWLRSTDTLVVVGAMGLALLSVLAIALRDRLTAATTGAESGGAPSARLLTWPELRSVAALVLAAAALTLTWRARQNRTIAHDMSDIGVTIELPRQWRSLNADGRVSLTRASWSGAPSLLVADTSSHGAGLTAAAVLRTSLERSPSSGIEPLSVARWERHYPGAIALDFRLNPAPESGSTPGFGTIVAAPLANGRALLVELRYAASDGRRKWDVARALQALPR